MSNPHVAETNANKHPAKDLTVRMLLCAVFVLGSLLTATPSPAQVVMGPPDDPYTPTHDISTSVQKVLNKRSLALAAGVATGPLDTIHVSTVDPSNWPEICAYVEVLDANGQPISGWDADSFCVRQDLTDIESFTVQEVQENCYSSVCLVIDVSGSMILDGKLDSAKAAANAFVDQMDVLDRVAVVTFSSCFTVVQDYTTDKDLLHAKINALQAAGYTAAFDGIWAGIDLTTAETGPRAVIALSDGMENRSWECSGPCDGIRFDDWSDDSTLIVGLAKSAAIPVYTISLGNEFDPEYLQKIAAGTGGDYYHAPGPADLNNIYSAIKTRLCSRYLICYTSPDLILDGDCHDVFVCRKNPTNGSCDHCGQGEYCEGFPPVITITPLPCQPWDQDVTVCATVTDSDTPVADLVVRLFYRNSDTDPFTQTTMTLQGGQFCATIPGNLLPCGGNDIQYYVTAYDGTSTASSPSGAPADHHTFSICPNHDPVCIVPPDQTIRQCQPEEVCFQISATDEDGNLVGCMIDDPKGGRTTTRSNGLEYCITPIGTQTVTINVHCWDDCGGECRTSFTVNFIIDEPPVLTCPPDYTFECNAIGDFGEPTVQDENPGTVTLSVSQDSIPGDCEQSYQLVRTWTATDECGNKGECTQTITVRDTQPPNFSGIGESFEVECPNEGTFTEPTITDDCDPNPTVTITDVEEPGTCPVLRTVTRTWVAVDACGNRSGTAQRITYVDRTPPTITCPAPLTLECGDPGIDDAITAWLASVTGSDACSQVTFRNSYSTINFTGCGGTGTQTVAFTASDECGNQTTCTSTITIVDTQKPVFTTCPADLTLECADPANEQLIADWLATAAGTDQCSAEVIITNNFDPANFAGGCNEYTGSQLVTFTAFDECGNSETCQATVTINDTQKPYFTFCPQDLELECVINKSIDPIGEWLLSATAEDQCDLDVTVTNDYDAGNFTGGCNQFTGSQLVTFTATDDCGNTETCTATVRISDTQKPYFTFCPLTLELECGDPANDGLIADWRASALALDDCDANQVDITDDYDPSGFTGGCSANTGSQLVTFTATDDCGNTEICQATIIIRDTQKPSFTFCPGDLELECASADNEATIAAWLLTATATDQCDADVEITNSYSPTAFTGGCSPNTGTQLVTFTATDDCGNTETCTASIIIRDTQKPYFTFCPTDIDIECSDIPADRIPDPLSGWLGSPTAEDACDIDVVITNDFDWQGFTGGCSDYTGSQLVTWTATDDCGNTEICQATVTIVDTQKPTFILCPDDLNLECGDPDNNLAIVNWLASATAGDLCDPEVVVTNDYDALAFTGGCSDNTGSQLVTFTATDDCGNTEICQATIWIRDTQIPEIMDCPVDLTLDCGDPTIEDQILAQIDFASARDMCDQDLTKTNTYDPQGFTGGCSPNTGSQLITITFTDDCGNQADCNFTVTIRDITKPVFTFCPQDLELECGAPDNDATIAGWLLTATATDECDPDVEITNSYLPDGFTGGCNPFTGSQLVTFTATDDCGNSEICQATIIIRDTQKPVFSLCPSDLELECASADNDAQITAWLLTATATDQCDADVEVTNSYDPQGFTGGCSPNTGTQLVTFTATDDCGNQEFCTASIIIRDTQKPYFTFCAANLELQCGDLGNAGAIGGWLNSVTAADQCDADVQLTNDFDLANLSGGCSSNTGSLLVTWTATDDCGNTETCQATLTIVDNLKPAFTFCPSDLELECADASNDAAIAEWLLTPTADDQCDVEVQVTNDYDPQGFTGGCSPSTGSQLVTFTATDDCGNTETCQASIIIRDTQQPYFTFCVDDLRLQCGDPGNAGAIGGWLNSPTAEDACDADVQITNDFDLANLSDGCSANTGSVLVTFTATDDCGNTATCQATLTIFDNLKPFFTLCPPPLELECDNAGNDQAISDWLASATAEDQCDIDVQITNDYDPDGLSGGCSPNTGSIVVTFTATDDCGNTETCQSSIIIRDTQKPYFTVCPADLDVDCSIFGATRNGDPIADWLASALAEDQCDPDVPVTHDFDFGNLTGGCSDYTGDILVTFTATDDCGNTETCQATVHITDTQKPTFTFCPVDLTLECDYLDPARTSFDPISDWLLSALATDNCDPEVQITNSYDPQGFTNGCGYGTGSQLVTFTATDDCGNTETCQATVTIQDTQPPLCTLPQSQAVFQCANAEICYDLFATDNCDPEPTCTIISGKGTIVNGQWCYTPTVDEVVTVGVECRDACGNTCSGSFTITIDVNEPPVVERPPDASDRICEFGEEVCVGPFSVSDPDNNIAGVSPNMGIFDGTNVCFNPPAEGDYQIILCATDECGAQDCDTVDVIVRANHPPVCQIPNDTTIFLCESQRVCLGFDGIDPDEGDFVTCTASNNIGESSRRDDCTTGDCPRYLWCYTPVKDEIVEVTVTCTDECGATCVGTFVVTFVMNQPPTCSAPAPLEIECGADNAATIASWLASASATDDQGPYTITNDYDPNGFVGESCGNTGYQEVTFTVTDSCGVQVSCTSTITIIDTTAPTCSAPDDLTLSCDDPEKDAKIANWLGSATGEDACGEVSVNNNYDVEAFDGCNGTGRQEVTFTVMDACENSATCTAVLMIEDIEAPICSAPDPLTLECSDPALEDKIGSWLASASGQDNCSAEVSITNDFSYEQFEGCANTGEQVVTFTVMDACENTSECSSTITIEDTEPPTIACAGDIDVLCIGDVPPPHAESVVASDACGSVLIEHVGDTELIEEPPCGGVITRTYRATDECGNYAECQQRIYVILGTPICVVPGDPTVEVCALQGEIRLPVSSIICEADFDGDARMQPHDEGNARTRTTTLKHSNTTITGGTYGKKQADRRHVGGNMAASVTQGGRCEVYAGPGFIENGEWVGYPAEMGEGPSAVTVRCYDDRCGLFCEETFTVNLIVNPDVNQPPTCTILNPPNPSPPPCGPNPGPPPPSVSIQGTDPEGGPVTCGLAPGSPGVVTDCVWEPDGWSPGPGSYVITIQCVDTCGAVSEAQFTVTILPQTQPPECVVPTSDQTYTLCQAGTVTAPVSAIGGVAPVTCAVVGGKGSIVNGQWTYNATTDESFTVAVRCTDACGNFCESSFNVHIDINDPPVCTMPDQYFAGCDIIHAEAAIQVFDDNLSSIKKLSGPGVITNGIWSYTAGIQGTYTVVFEAKDACNAKTQCAFNVTFDLNDPPECNVRDTTITVCDVGDVTLLINPTDPDLGVRDGENVTCTLISGPGSIVGNEWHYHLLEMQPVTLTIRCTDACGLYCEKTITVDFEQGDAIAGLCDNWDDRTIKMCGPGTFCLDIPPHCGIVLGQGKVEGINLCFSVEEAGVYWADIECEDGCGNTCSQRAYLTVVFDPSMPECISIAASTTPAEERKSAGGVSVSPASESCPCPLRGDLNYDNEITAEDMSQLAALFTDGRQPTGASADCPALNVADVNCDGALTTQDVQYLAAYLYQAGPAPCTKCASQTASIVQPRPITDLEVVNK